MAAPAKIRRVGYLGNPPPGALAMMAGFLRLVRSWWGRAPLTGAEMQQATKTGQAWPENETAVVADVSMESRERNRLLRVAVALLGLIVLLEVATLTVICLKPPNTVYVKTD